MGYLTTSQMVSDLQRRIPIGLSSTTCIDRLNEAYRWVCQRGPMIWLLKETTVTATVLVTLPASPPEIYFTLPTDLDTGRPAYLSTASPSVEIPYKPYDQGVRNQVFTTVVPGMYSVWSIVGTKGILFPVDAYSSGTAVLPIVYHTKPGAALTTGSSTFPSPDAFDTTLVELAESEIRRIYSMAGWDIVQKRAQESAQLLAVAYHSTKATMAGLADQQATTQESQLAKAQ